MTNHDLLTRAPNPPNQVGQLRHRRFARCMPREDFVGSGTDRPTTRIPAITPPGAASYPQLRCQRRTPRANRYTFCAGSVGVRFEGVDWCHASTGATDPPRSDTNSALAGRHHRAEPGSRSRHDEGPDRSAAEARTMATADAAGLPRVALGADTTAGNSGSPAMGGIVIGNHGRSRIVLATPAPRPTQNN